MERDEVQGDDVPPHVGVDFIAEMRTEVDVVDAMFVTDYVERRARKLLQGWLAEAGFDPRVKPCRVTFRPLQVSADPVRSEDGCSAWCGNPGLSDRKAVVACWTRREAWARVESYDGGKVYCSRQGATVVEALRALVDMPRFRSVPENFLRATEVRDVG